MATLYIREYSKLATDDRGSSVIVGLEPGIDNTLSIGANTTLTLNLNTKFVRLHSDAICCVAFGGASVAATTSSGRMAANQTEFFGISSGSPVLAVIAGT